MGGCLLNSNARPRQTSTSHANPRIKPLQNQLVATNQPSNHFVGAFGVEPVDPYRFNIAGHRCALHWEQIFTLNPLTTFRVNSTSNSAQIYYNKERVQIKGYPILSQQALYVWVPRILRPDSSGSPEFQRKPSELHVTSNRA